METCKDEPNKRATPGAENTANKQRPVDAKLKNYIHNICGGGIHILFPFSSPWKNDWTNSKKINRIELVRLSVYCFR